MEHAYGASAEEWEAFIALARDDVRPVVSDPTIPPSQNSVIKDPLKVPTVINRSGCYAGLVGWQSMTPTQSDLTEWAATPQYGISLVGRTFHAIDIDVDDEAEATEIAESIYAFFDCKLPTRRRHNQARRLMMFKVSDNSEPLKKVVLTTANGKVEFLLHKQQFVVAGTHKTGARHYWEDGLPTEVPAITLTQYRALLRFLQEEFGSADDVIDIEKATNVQVERRDSSQTHTDDPEYQMVLDSPYFREILSDGKVALYCPWQHLHTSTGGEPDENPSAVVYFPKGLGGREESGFRCMHTSHGEKNIQHLREELGYVPPEFEVIAVPEDKEPPAPPQLMGNSKSSIPPNVPNLVNCLMTPDWLGVAICFDDFTGTMQINWDNKGWRDFKDADYPALTIRLMQKVGFKDVPKDKLRDSVILVAELSHRDSAIEWIETLRWDGIERVRHTAHRILGTTNTPYAEAVSCYIWTAMAGRVLSPGSKADMVAVLISDQGARKSSFVRALSPHGKDWHTDLALDTKEADTYRLTRGKVIAEVPELRGLGSREEEHIKAWLTKGEDSWIPKYQENAVTLKRRFIMIGTNNYQRFLSDTTGNRRWLPMRVCMVRDFIDTDRLKAELDQYWAEARVMYEKHGIMWKEAEHLAKLELPKFTRQDIWYPTILAFVKSQEETFGEPLSAASIAAGALNIPPQSLNAAIQFRIEGVLRTLGYEQNPDDAFWYQRDLT